MARSGDELLELITATLDLSRLESGRTTVEVAAARLEPLLAAIEGEARELLRGKPAVALHWSVADLPVVPETELPTDLDLVSPVVPEWVVGTLSVAYDDAEDRIILQADELVDEEAGEEGGHARFHLTRAQVVAYCNHAEELVASGRPPCPICGQPMDPDGHVCPRSNGHR